MGRPVPGGRLVRLRATRSGTPASSSSRSSLSLPFWAASLALGRRRLAQAADAAAAARRLLARGHARPRLGRGRARRRRRARRALGARRPGRPRRSRRASTSSWRGCTGRAGREEIFTFQAEDQRVARGRRLRRVPRAARGGVRTTGRRTRRTRWARAGWAPIPATSVADGRGAAARRRRASGSATRPRCRRAPGVNPMITIMALARRTAHAIVEDLRAAARCPSVSASRGQRTPGSPRRSGPSPR